MVGLFCRKRPSPQGEPPRRRNLMKRLNQQCSRTRVAASRKVLLGKEHLPIYDSVVGLLLCRFGRHLKRPQITRMSRINHQPDPYHPRNPWSRMHEYSQPADGFTVSCGMFRVAAGRSGCSIWLLKSSSSPTSFSCLPRSSIPQVEHVQVRLQI